MRSSVWRMNSINVLKKVLYHTNARLTIQAADHSTRYVSKYGDCRSQTLSEANTNPSAQQLLQTSSCTHTLQHNTEHFSLEIETKPVFHKKNLPPLNQLSSSSLLLARREGCGASAEISFPLQDHALSDIVRYRTEMSSADKVPAPPIKKSHKSASQCPSMTQGIVAGNRFLEFTLHNNTFCAMKGSDMGSATVRLKCTPPRSLPSSAWERCIVPKTLLLIRF